MQKRWDGEVIYVTAGTDSARRKQLIDQKVPFVVPGNQVYLPMLGIDLREHFKSSPGSRGIVEPCGASCIPPSPAAPDKGALSPREMAECLGYAAMSMSRAFDELESTALVVVPAPESEGSWRWLARRAISGREPCRCCAALSSKACPCPGISWKDRVAGLTRIGLLHQHR